MIVNKQLAQSKGVEKKDLWETPDYIFKLLNNEFQFTLDPCCTKKTRKCNEYLTPSDDGLIANWKGKSVFCNPPYSRGNIDKWVEKCYRESLKEDTIVVGLFPVSTSSRWWHKWVIGKGQLRFVERRIRFKGAKYTAPFSSVIVIYGATGVKSFSQNQQIAK